MTVKNIKVAGFFISFLSFALALLFYDAFPCFLTSVFFPVSQSLFESLKVIISGTLISLLIQYFILEKNTINVKNLSLSIFTTVFIDICLFIIFYLPITLEFGINLIFTLAFLIIISIFNQFISYYFIFIKNFGWLNYLALIGIIIIYIILGLLTYYPFLNDVFFDKNEHKFGINTYLI